MRLRKKKALMSHKSQQLGPRFKEHALSEGVKKTWIAPADLHLMFVLMFETPFPVMQPGENGTGMHHVVGCGTFLFFSFFCSRRKTQPCRHWRTWRGQIWQR